MKTYKIISKKKFQVQSYSIDVIQKENIEQIRIWRNDQIDILRQKKHITSSEQIKYFKNNVWPEMYLKYPEKILMNFNKNKELIGYGGLVNISWKNKKAELSFLLSSTRCNNEKIYDKDFTVFLKLIKKLAFEYLNFESLFSETYNIRPKHINILENNSFIQRKIIKKNIKIKGKLIDSIFHVCQKN
tara:strand:- start:83 stop:643 length:561 start_codon:yes stop_codon:yes gene_type:complete